MARTPQGGIRAPAALTRTGILIYTNPDGSERREYRPAEEVFKADSLATLADAPVTNLHQGMVTAGNWRRVAIGAVSGEARQDGEHVTATLVIQDEETIKRIESGTDRDEVSCGYSCSLDPTPGVTESGERYDAIQRDIVYNHVALVPRGRAGREIALRLDHDGNQTPQAGDVTMKIEIINGTEYEVGSDAHRKAVQERGARASKQAARLDALESENRELKARADAAPADLAKAVAARTALVDTARRVGLEVRTDASDRDIQAQVIAKVLPKMSIEGKDEHYVSALFDVALGKIEEGAGGSAERVREDAAAPLPRSTEREDADGLSPAQRAHANMRKRNQNANINWKSN